MQQLIGFFNLMRSIFSLLPSLSPAKRIAIALTLVMLIGLTAYAWKQYGTQANVKLYSGRQLSQTELGVIETALGRAGLNCYEIVDQRIEIPRSQRAAVLKAIDDANATPKSFVQLSHSNTTYSPFLTGAQQRNIQKVAKQEKICAMIREIQGIADVMVEYDETRTESFPRTVYRTAAVTVRPDGDQHLQTHEIETVLSTVQRAVAGLEVEDIVVIDGNSGIAHDWNSLQQQPIEVQDHDAIKAQYEAEWKSKIEEALVNYPEADIAVDIECDQIVMNLNSTSPVQENANRYASTTGRIGAELQVAGDIRASIRSETNAQTAPLRNAESGDGVAQPKRFHYPLIQPHMQNSSQEELPIAAAVASDSFAQAGSNGVARVSDYSPVLPKAARNIRLVSAEVPAAIPTATTSRPGTHSVLKYVPQFASVSIEVPESQIFQLAQSHNRKNLKATIARNDANDDSETISADQIRPTKKQMALCFAKVKSDIVRRVAPLLPQTANAIEKNSIAVTLRNDLHASVASTESTSNSIGQLIQRFLSKNGSILAIPLLCLVGWVILKATRKSPNDQQLEQQERILQMLDQHVYVPPPRTGSTLTANDENRSPNNDPAVAQSKTETKKSRTQPTKRSIPEVHSYPKAKSASAADTSPVVNSVHDPDREVELGVADVNAVVEPEREIGLSKEIIEMIQRDPRASIGAFRSWLKETT